MEIEFDRNWSYVGHEKRASSIVTELNLSYQNLTSIPEYIFKMKNLEILKLDNNLISTVPSAIANLSHLKVLILSSNKIQELPRELAEMKSLQKLDVSWNDLKTLPSNFYKLFTTEKERYYIINSKNLKIYDHHSLNQLKNNKPRKKEVFFSYSNWREGTPVASETYSVDEKRILYDNNPQLEELFKSIYPDLAGEYLKEQYDTEQEQLAAQKLAEENTRKEIRKQKQLKKKEQGLSNFRANRERSTIIGKNRDFKFDRFLSSTA